MEILSTWKDYIFYAAFAIIIIISVVLRIYRIDYYPAEIDQDELSNLYDGYSIIQTGADRWGMKYPAILRAFGDYDYRPPLYAWLCALSIKIFGYSTFAGRFPSVVLGCLSLLIIYFTAKRIGGPLFALLSLLLAGLSPWHMLFSRIGLESSILHSFFTISAFYVWLTAKAKQYSTKYLVLLGFVIGFGANAYQAGKLIFCILALIIMVDVYIHAIGTFKKISLFALSCLLGAAPQIFVAVTMPEHFFARANETMFSFSFSFHYFNTFLRNFCWNLSPDFLFFSFGEHNYLTVGRLLTFEFFFFYLGLFFFSKLFKKSPVFHPVYLYIFITLSIIPGALTKINPHALRISGLNSLLPMVSAAGIIFVYRQIPKPPVRYLFLLTTIGLLILNSIFFIKDFVQSEHLRTLGFQNFLVQMATRVNQYTPYYSRIYIEDFGNQPYIYIANYCHITPAQFQGATKQIRNIGWDHFIQLDKYFFLKRNQIEEIAQQSGDKNLYVLLARNNSLKLIDSLNTSKTPYYFYEK